MAIQRSDLLRELKAVVQTHGPDYRDKGDDSGLARMVYADGRRCLVGATLERFRVRLPAADDPMAWRSLAAFAREAAIEIELDALDLLIRAQQLQDDGVPWGSVLAAVIEEFEIEDEEVPWAS